MTEDEPGEIKELKPEDKPLSVMEEAYCQAYLIHRQKAKAARVAGYKKSSDRFQGYVMHNKPHVRKRINQLMEENTIGGKEAVKILSDMAEFNLADYMVAVEVPETPMVRISLSDLIDQKKEALRREQLFLKRKATTDPDEKIREQREIKNMELAIMRLEIDLEANPKEMRVVKGETRLVKEMQLDIDRLVKDKERGRIKSIKNTKDGIQVEGYDARAAAVDIAKIHGEFEKDNAQSRPVLPVTPEEIIVRIVRSNSPDE